MQTGTAALHAGACAAGRLIVTELMHMDDTSPIVATGRRSLRIPALREGRPAHLAIAAAAARRKAIP